MSFLVRRTGRAWAGWRDLDAVHARPDENPIQPPWRRTNTGRNVWLENNILSIADGLSTPMQLGGVSYEQQPFTSNWGCEMDLNIDGAILIQQQFFAACISPTWTSVAFTDLANRPMVAIHRNVGQVGNTLKVMVYHDLNTIETLAETGELSGLMNRTWCRFTVLVDRDRLVRAYINGVFLIQQWLPSGYASGPGKRAMNFLNQCTAWSMQRNFVLFDQVSDFQSVAPWSEVYADNFNRVNGPPGNGWTQLGTDAAIVNNTWSTTGTTAGSRGLIRDTGVTNGVQRIEGTIGGDLPPSSQADSSLILRTNATGSEGLAANIFSGHLYLAHFTGGLEAPTFSDFENTDEIAVPDGATLAFAVTGQAAWIELNGAIVLMADVNHTVTTTNSWAGLRVERASSSNSASWNDVRILTRS
ncbi:hypothetical protein ABZ412_34120 [Nocardia sp. NPDC005746]|uniref:hypothetical protein n=1 Tax=Nocardia sp. NPDC005746 TaxID=3157062 RepID=UPI0033E062FF